MRCHLILRLKFLRQPDVFIRHIHLEMRQANLSLHDLLGSAMTRPPTRYDYSIAKQFGKEKVALLKKLKNLEEVNEYEISEAQEMIDYHQRKSIIQGYEIDNLEAQIIAMEREMETKIKQFNEEIHEEREKRI